MLRSSCASQRHAQTVATSTGMPIRVMAVPKPNESAVTRKLNFDYAERQREQQVQDPQVSAGLDDWAQQSSDELQATCHPLRSPYGHPYHPADAPGDSRIAAALGVLAGPPAAEAAPGMLSIEGTFSYVEVKDSGGDAVSGAGRRSIRRDARHLPSGVYRRGREPARGAVRAPGARVLEGPHRGARERPCAQAVHHEPARAARSLPVAAADSSRPALSQGARRDQLVVPDRQLGPRSRVRAAPRVRERKPREGHAAHVLPARHRQPDAGRGGARARSGR